MFEENAPQGQATQVPVSMQPTGMTGQSTLLSTPRQVYTMPEKFMQPRVAPSSGVAKKWVIVAVVSVVVLIILVAIIVYAFQTASTNNGAANTQNSNVAAVTNQNVNARNGNANTNTNAGSNSNGNTNAGVLNLNVNSSVGNNINAGLFPNNGNRNTNSGNTTNVNGSIGLPDRSNVANGRDKDRDGLTDVEEDMYKTRFDLPDSDKDGFVDGTEVRNLFSPSEAGKSLLESGLAIAYAQPEFGWSVSYPADWIAEPVNDSRSEVMFSSDSVSGEFIEVLVTENTKRQTAAEWYASLYENVKPNQLEAITLGGLQGIISPDGFTYYLADANFLIGIVYNFGTKDQVQFRTTFEMMAKSFRYTPVVRPSPTTNTNAASLSNTNAATTNTNSANTNSAQ